jgi:AraC-like DNA-binding protein
MATAAKLATERQSGEATASRLFERHFSPAELAEQWNLSEDTLRRIFERELDVLIFENPERGSLRRRRTLRIPESVAERVYRRLCNRGFDRKG